MFVFADTRINDNLFANVSTDFISIFSSPARINFSSLAYLTAGGAGLTYLIDRDVTFYHDIHDNRSVFLDKLAAPISLLGDGFLHLGLYGFLLTYGNSKDREIAGAAFEGFVTVGLFSFISKSAISASRPTTDEYNHSFFKFFNANGSFPSGHTIVAFSQAAILGELYRIEYITYPLAILVGITRIYQGEHWPSDVLAGALAGIWIGKEVLNNYHKRNEVITWQIKPNLNGQIGFVASYYF